MAKRAQVSLHLLAAPKKNSFVELNWRVGQIHFILTKWAWPHIINLFMEPLLKQYYTDQILFVWNSSVSLFPRSRLTDVKPPRSTLQCQQPPPQYIFHISLFSAQPAPLILIFPFSKSPINLSGHFGKKVTQKRHRQRDKTHQTIWPGCGWSSECPELNRDTQWQEPGSGNLSQPSHNPCTQREGKCVGDSDTHPEGISTVQAIMGMKWCSVTAATWARALMTIQAFQQRCCLCLVRGVAWT